MTNDHMPSMPDDSPWGPLKHTREIAPGVLDVLPTGAMGPHLMIAAAMAETHLSPAARRRGTPYEGYVCFGSERRGVWAIAAWELDWLQPALFANAKCIIAQGVAAYLQRRLEQFHQDYLQERGTRPEAGGTRGPQHQDP